MIIDLGQLSATEVYFSMIQTVIPRPIAWVLSKNAGDDFNLAPFSYFNAVCSDPPLLMISIGRKNDGSFKDTKVNIEERGEFVVHLVNMDTLDAMNESSATLPYGASELTASGLETIEFDGFPLPRLRVAKVAFACTRYQVIQVGATPQSLVLGEVRRIFVDDSVVGMDGKGRTKIQADRIRPVGRLGAGEYVTFGDLVHRTRPA